MTVENRVPAPGQDPGFDALMAMFSNTLHSYPAIDQQPSVRLTQWQVMKILGRDGKLIRQLVGRFDYEGRKSSEIELFDPVTLQATTASGRCYALLGPPGEDPDAMWVWSRFAASRVKWWNVTRAVMRLRRRKLAELGLVANKDRRRPNKGGPDDHER